MEVLVSMVLIAALAGALTTGLITTMRASAGANDIARANVLMTSFEESLLQLEYRPCSTGDLVAVYTAAFADYEQDLPPHRRVVNDSGLVSAEVVSVDTGGGCANGDPDLGIQTLELELTYHDSTRSGAIVKRNPAPADGPQAGFDPTVLSNPGDPLGIVTLDASRSTPRATLVEYAWDCGDHGPTGDPANTTFVTSTHDDPAARCNYNATSTDEVYTISLTVLDQDGVTNTATEDVTIGAASSPRLPPVAVIQTSCGTTSPCPSGDADLSVDFDGSSSNSLDGTVVSYRWNFGDPLSGSVNTATTSTSSHVFTRDQVHTVTLVVTDEIGLTGSATYDIDVNVPGLPPPTASFTMSPVPAVAPQNMNFDGTSSHDDSGGPVSSYSWDFGDGTTGVGAKPSKLYSLDGVYSVSLTVTDSAGTTATTTQVLNVQKLVKPPSFRLTDAEGELADHGRFRFAWTNGPASAGDTVEIEINIAVVQGCVAFGNKTRTVAASAPGSTQTHTWVQTWPASNVCVGSKYRHRARTKRTSPTNGVSYSPWTDWVEFWVTHT
ncbi:MAG: PKD domain-containing protein [Microthrixaceae bacterium]|nr:PKD domain-containing protein [Microthrixaceae bacterium]